MPILFSITFISMMGFGIIFPLFPLFKVKFELSDLQIGSVVSTSAIATLFGSLLLGYISDKIGRKLPLSLPLFFLSIIYIFTAYADNFTTFFILRVLAGFFLGNFAVAFAAASDLSTPQNKVKTMGLIGASFGMGFIFGPAIGGYFAGNSNNIHDVDFASPFNISAILCFIVGLISLFLFKETLPKEDRLLKNKDNIIKQFKNLFNNKEFLFLTYISLIFNTIAAGIQVFLGIYLNFELNYTPQDIGLYWGAYGILMSFAQIFLSRYFTTKKSLIYGFLIYGISIGLITFTNNTYLLLLPTIGMVIAFATIGPNINAGLSLQGEKNQQGLIFGLNQAFGSMGRILGPNIIAAVYFFSHKIIWLFITLICIMTATAIYYHINKKK